MLAIFAYGVRILLFLDFWEFCTQRPNGFYFQKISNFGVFTSFCVPPSFLRFSWHELGRELRQSIWMLVKTLLHFGLHWDACSIRHPDFGLVD